jgi:single-stranded DNA-specific DHH superfamily exonuclease
MTKHVATKEQIERVRDWSGMAGRKLVFYHNDPDGISSAALWMGAFPGFEPVAREGPIMKPEFVRWVGDQDPDVLVFLDLPVDQEWKKLAWLQKHYPDAKIIIIDHHIPDKDMNSARTVHVNNKFIARHKNKYLPAAFLVYETLELLDDDAVSSRLEQVKWVAGAGIIGDYGQKDCAGFFKGIRGKMKSMGSASDLMSAAVTLKGRKGAARILKILLRIGAKPGGMEEFNGRKMLNLWKRYVDAEVDKTLERYRKEREVFAKARAAFFRINSKLNIVSVISTLLSSKSPDRTIIIYKQSANGMWKASGRLQSGRLDLGTTFKKAVKNIGTGGGHKQAAGARVNDWDVFKKRVLTELVKTKKSGKSSVTKS